MLPVLHRPGQGGRQLLVLLPGAYTTPEDFVAAGFDSALAERHPAWSLAIPALQLDAISDGSALEQLHSELIQPALAAGRQVWLGGISLGGFLAMAYAQAWPGTLAGLCLLAPYPGSRITTGAIKAAGGLCNWIPADPDDPEARVWTWLRDGAGELPAYLGYGSDDRFALGMGMLAAAWPDARLQTRPGGHDWPVWRALWDDFLDSGLLPQGSPP